MHHVHKRARNNPTPQSRRHTRLTYARELDLLLLSDMRCGFVSPSPALSAALRPPSMLPTMWPGARPAPSFPRQKLGPGETAAFRPRAVVTRAQMNHGREVEEPLEPNHFVDEIRSIVRHSIHIGTPFEGFLVRAHLRSSIITSKQCYVKIQF